MGKIERIDPLLPDRGERGPEIEGKRRKVNGIIWVPRTGAPGSDMPGRDRNWSSVYVRLSRWSKSRVLDAAFETLASMGLRQTRNMPTIPRLCGCIGMQP